MPRCSPSQLHVLRCLFACVLYGQWHEIQMLIEVYCRRKKVAQPKEKKNRPKKMELGKWLESSKECNCNNGIGQLLNIAIRNTASKSHNGLFHSFCPDTILPQVQLINGAVILFQFLFILNEKNICFVRGERNNGLLNAFRKCLNRSINGVYHFVQPDNLISWVCHGPKIHSRFKSKWANVSHFYSTSLSHWKSIQFHIYGNVLAIYLDIYCWCTFDFCATKPTTQSIYFNNGIFREQLFSISKRKWSRNWINAHSDRCQ